MKPTLSEAMKARLADLCGDDRVKTALQVCVDAVSYTHLTLPTIA